MNFWHFYLVHASPDEAGYGFVHLYGQACVCK